MILLYTLPIRFTPGGFSGGIINTQALTTKIMNVVQLLLQINLHVAVILLLISGAATIFFEDNSNIYGPLAQQCAINDYLFVSDANRGLQFL